LALNMNCLQRIGLLIPKLYCIQKLLCFVKAFQIEFQLFVGQTIRIKYQLFISNLFLILKLYYIN
jgi:hypothetical protein